jgi:hypothetical protein
MRQALVSVVVLTLASCWSAPSFGTTTTITITEADFTEQLLFPAAEGDLLICEGLASPNGCFGTISDLVIFTPTAMQCVWYRTEHCECARTCRRTKSSHYIYPDCGRTGFRG